MRKDNNTQMQLVLLEILQIGGMIRHSKYSSAINKLYSNNVNSLIKSKIIYLNF